MTERDTKKIAKDHANKLQLELKEIETIMYKTDAVWWKKLTKVFEKCRLSKRRKEINDYLWDLIFGNKKVAVIKTEPKVQFCSEDTMETQNMEYDYYGFAKPLTK